MAFLKRLGIFTFLLLSLHGYGSHIAGGEFRMTHIYGFQFKIDLVIYFDVHNGAAGAKDAFVAARIFRNSDNTVVTNVSMPLISENLLSYNQLSCSVEEVQLSEIIYSATIILQPDVFSDPAGYYIAWERCCRNYGITNIHSEPPPAQAAGQAFYLQFPHIIKNDQLFINSSPKMQRPVVDYTCVGYPYFADFSAQDADEDSLVYSVTTPWSTHTVDALPQGGPGPKPYPEVVWRPTFNSQHVMGGNSTLYVNNNGIVSVTPPLTGLFSFAVKCEEYRDGKKIGEVRREFQITSLSCAPQTAPVIAARTSGGMYSELPLTVNFDNSVNDANRCVQVKVSDIDVSNSNQEIRILAIPIGFDKNVSGFLPDVSSATLTQATPSAEFSICFDRCPPTVDKTFQVGIVAYDASCAVPLTDTIRITVMMEIPEGQCLHQKISFPKVDDKSESDGLFALGAASSSGLPVTYLSSDNTIVALSSSMVNPLKPGFVAVTAIQSGDAQYLPADSVKRRFCVNPQPPVLTFLGSGPSAFIQSSSSAFHVWYIDGVLQGSHSGSSISVLGGGSDHFYTARVLIDNCLSEESDSVLVKPLMVTGVENFRVQIFPNPVVDNLYISFDGDSFQSRRIQLRGVIGQMIFETETSGETMTIDMNGLKAGIYLLTMEDGTHTAVRKIIKR